MKAILIDELVKDTDSACVIIDAVKYEGWQIAKPLNYEPDYVSISERRKMVKLILQGKAIAVQFFSDLTEDEKIEYVKSKMK